jgi:hypothetical protein
MGAPPPGLCPAHRRIWSAWRDHTYNSRAPKDWPGQILLDARTSHADRRADWNRKNTEQMQLTADLCTSGRSPQCDHTD